MSVGIHFTSLAANFYSGLGFDISLEVAHILIIFLPLASVFHLSMIIIHAIDSGWPELVKADYRVVLFLLCRVVVMLVFGLFVIGALGDNISSRSVYKFSKILSGSIGCLVLGSWIWLVNDFFGALYINYSRRR